MPRGDRTGPNGFGPMTGRKMGFCAGNNAPGYMNQGFGYRRGRGFGYKRIYWDEPIAEIPRTEYKEPTKKEQLEELKAEKKAIEKVIEELEKE
jgi:hypothetical protein